MGVLEIDPSGNAVRPLLPHSQRLVRVEEDNTGRDRSAVSPGRIAAMRRY